MKNHIKLLILSVFLSTGLWAQNSGRIGSHDAIGKWTPSAATSFTTVAEGRQIAQQIIDIMGLKPNFELREANIPNAAAVVYGGQRYVLFNPNFIRDLEKKTGTKWAAISVLAHEIGHHLNGHTLSGSGSQPPMELESDEFSGFVLRKMGASLSESQAAMKTLATARASRTHPGQYDRLTAIENGWNKADSQLTGKTYVAKQSPAPVQQETGVAVNQRQRTPVASPIEDRYIIGDVRFNSDKNTTYYVTERYNLVRVRNNQISIIGKLTSLNSQQYPYLIYDEANTQLLVDVYGNIVTKGGRQVGKLSSRKM